MAAKLTATCGKHKRLDFLMQDSLWSEPRDRMQGLLNRERVLMASWSRQDGSSVDVSFSSIALVVGVHDTSSGYIAIEYSFANIGKAEAEIAALEDDAL